MRRHHRDLEILSEMNLTNLLDTAFILLIVFILIAPMLKHGIEIDLPKVSRGPMQTGDKTLTIVIRKAAATGLSENIYIGDEERRVDLAELREAITERRKLFPELAVVIEADRESTYDTLAKVLATLQNMGVYSIGLPLEPEELQPE